MNPSIKKMIDAVREAVSNCKAPEKETLEALMAESEGWDMRLEELDDGDDEDNE